MITDTNTPERLLLSARRLFAARGYEGTSVRDLTRAARANLGAVTYHFGSKERLYHEVLRRLFQQLVERVTLAVAPPADPVQRLERFVGAMFDQFEENPDMPRLLVQELSRGRRGLPPPVREAQGRIRTLLLELVEQGQKDGSILPGPPILFALSLLSQPVYFAIVRPILTLVAGIDMDDPDVRAAVVSHARAFARRGLTAQPQNQS
ncbi:MAG: TetR/AcrR family transcriptional regulator [Gemmatimonadales bacterium]